MSGFRASRVYIGLYGFKAWGLGGLETLEPKFVKGCLQRVAMASCRVSIGMLM